MIDINPNHLQTVRQILAQHLPACEVRAFGSRVTWTAKDYSDLDLAIVGAAALDRGTLARLREAFEESDLPILVDLLDWHAISQSFQDLIEQDYAVLQEMTDRPGGSVAWNLTTVGEFAPFVYGKALPERARNSEGSVPVYGSNGIVGFHDVALTDGPTVVIGRKGTAGAVHYSPVPCWPIDTTFFFTGRDLDLIRFTYYALKTLRLEGMNSDSAVPGLNRTAAHARALPVPKESEQRAIAHILGTLDDKIALNRRMNQTLEEMARALFKSWFVDFDPVRAKMEGRWRRGQSLPGMPADLYDLFPDHLVDSELGEIPEGWEVVSLPEFMDFKEGPGIRHWQYTNSLEGTRFINIRCIQNGDLHLETANRIKTEEADGKYAHFHLKEWDIVISTSGTLGRTAIVRKTHLPLLLNTSVIRFRPVKGVSLFSFLCGYLNSSLFLDEMRILASGSVQKNFGPTHLKKMRVLCPPLKLIERHEEVASPLYRQIISRRVSSDNLSCLRDYLLPKLISGEIRMKDAEAFLGRGS